jgi:Phosphotransferase enzyme family
VHFDGFVGTGQMSRNARFSLTWDRSDDRPRTVVGKFPTDDPTTRASSFASGVYFNEYSFYDQIAATVNVRTPRCWVARYDADGQDFVLIMEDMAESVQGDQFSGCSPDEIALAIEQACALHSPRWGDPTLAQEPALQPGDDGRGERLERYFGGSAEGCLARIGHRLDDDVVELIRAFVPHLRRWAEGTGTPHTVVHGDFRPDNFLFGRTDSAPPLAVVDWQTVSKGVGVADVAYLIAGAHPPEVRREVERDLLGEYRARLNAAGIDYSAEDSWRDYRWAALHGLIISVCAVVMAEHTERGDNMLTLMAARHGRHALDLDTLSMVRA